MKVIVALAFAIVLFIAAAYITVGVSVAVLLLGNHFPVLPAAAACFFAFSTGVGLVSGWVPPPLTSAFVLSIACSAWAFSGRVAGGFFPHLAAIVGAPVAVCLLGALCAFVWSAFNGY